MRLKLDENLPRSARARLAALGFDVDTVLDESLGGRRDEEVWTAAQAAEQWRIGDHLVAGFSTAEARSWSRCFVVITANKVWVLRPPVLEEP